MRQLKISSAVIASRTASESSVVGSLFSSLFGFQPILLVTRKHGFQKNLWENSLSSVKLRSSKVAKFKVVKFEF